MLNVQFSKVLYGCILGQFLMKMKVTKRYSNSWNVSDSYLKIARENVNLEPYHIALHFNREDTILLCKIGFCLGGDVGRALNDYCMRNLHPLNGFSYCGLGRMNLNKPTYDDWPLTMNELTQLFKFYGSFARYIKT